MMKFLLSEVMMELYLTRLGYDIEDVRSNKIPSIINDFEFSVPSTELIGHILLSDPDHIETVIRDPILFDDILPSIVGDKYNMEDVRWRTFMLMVAIGNVEPAFINYRRLLEDDPNLGHRVESVDLNGSMLLILFEEIYE